MSACSYYPCRKPGTVILTFTSPLSDKAGELRACAGHVVVVLNQFNAGRDRLRSVGIDLEARRPALHPDWLTPR